MKLQDSRNLGIGQPEMRKSWLWPRQDHLRAIRVFPAGPDSMKGLECSAFQSGVCGPSILEMLGKLAHNQIPQPLAK